MHGIFTPMPQEYFEETFENTDFSNQSLTQRTYECCTFKNCNFSNADLSDTKFIETEFINCDLSNANISNTSFQDIKYRNCKILGLPFEKSNAFNFTIHCMDCQLGHCSFYQVKLNRSSFTGCKLENVDFTETDMKKVVLMQCDLRYATFENTNLENADLRQSTNYVIDPDSNTIKGAQFSLPDVIGLLAKYNINIEK